MSSSLCLSVIAALRENQEDLRTLPMEIPNFTGRDKEMEDLALKLSPQEEASQKYFHVIKGGPCCGKTSLAIMLGHKMFEEGYNYVIWVNMRDLTSTEIPKIGDVALKILQEFGIDTSEMKSDVVSCLNQKLESITATKKRALLIFDNADNLLQSSDDSNSLFELKRLIDNNSRGKIRAIFTARYCQVLEDEFDTIKLKTLSDESSKRFLNAELCKHKIEHKEDIVSKLAEICQGLPYALKITVSAVKQYEESGILQDYLDDLKQNPIDTISGENQNIEPLFLISFKYLNKEEQELLRMLAVFPTGFKYAAVKMLAKSVNAKARLLNSLSLHGLVTRDYQEEYIMHPFLGEILRKHEWDPKKKERYEREYYSLFVKLLFELARDSLNKDNYCSCLQDFMQHKNNFQFVIEKIGNGFEGDLQKDNLIGELVERPSPDYISSLLFLIDLIPPTLVTKFFEGCEKYAHENLKPVIRCCAYDISMKYYSHAKIIPPDVDELDEYGHALLDKRTISTTIQEMPFVGYKEKEFHADRKYIDEVIERIKKLENHLMRAYFEHKLLKLKSRIYKKADLNLSKVSEVAKLHEESIKICEENFGNNWLTIDCHNQLAKSYWKYNENEKALQAFVKAEQIGEEMKVTGNKKFTSILLDKGRFLIESNFQEKRQEGVSMIEEVLKSFIEVTDIKFWCLALRSLISFDSSRYGKMVIEKFFSIEVPVHPLLTLISQKFHTEMESLSNEVDESIGFQKGEKIVDDLREARNHLEKKFKEYNLKEDSLEKDTVARTMVIFLYKWNVYLAKKCRPLLTISERQKFAEEAIGIGKEYKWVEDHNTFWLEITAKGNADGVDESLLQRKDYLEFISKNMNERGMNMELKERYKSLLNDSSSDQRLWSMIVKSLSKDDPTIYGEVTQYLLNQTEPCEDLLRLAKSKFFFELDIIKTENDEAKIIRKSKQAIHDLKIATDHLIYVQEHHSVIKDCIQKAVGEWSKLLALKTGHVLIKDHCRPHAKRALEVSEIFPKIINEKDKKDLKRIVDDRQFLSDTEQDRERKITMFAKRSSFIRKHEGQDELERKYTRFLFDCQSYPRVLINMVRFVIKNNHVPPVKYMEYIRFLEDCFESQYATKTWDYQFIVEILPIILSCQESYLESIVFAKRIYSNLAAKRASFSLTMKKKLEFQFLVILCLEVDPRMLSSLDRSQFVSKALQLLRDGRFPVCEDENDHQMYMDLLNNIA